MPTVRFIDLHAAADANADGAVAWLDAATESVIGVTVAQVGVGVVQFEGSGDGENWHRVQAANLGDGVAVTSTTASGMFRVEGAGLAAFRAPLREYASGSFTVRAFVQLA